MTYMMKHTHICDVYVYICICVMQAFYANIEIWKGIIPNYYIAIHPARPTHHFTGGATYFGLISTCSSPFPSNIGCWSLDQSSTAPTFPTSASIMAPPASSHSNNGCTSALSASLNILLCFK